MKTVVYGIGFTLIVAECLMLAFLAQQGWQAFTQAAHPQPAEVYATPGDQFPQPPEGKSNAPPAETSPG